jgi:hypothetical protein
VVTYPACLSLRNTAGAPGGKKLKTPTPGAQGIKTMTKKLQMLKSQHRMKQ